MRPTLAYSFVFEKIHDVQVLVDVSANTAQTDPKRHRVEAVRLLIDLLPEGAYASFWELAEKPALMYPPGVVSNDWREEVSDAALGLHAKAKAVDLESAIQSASRRWSERDPEFERALIILMDNEHATHLEEPKRLESRKAIMDKWIPQLARLGVKVYTLALSNKADIALLEALALGTGGWYKRADRSADFSHLMLDLFEQLTSPAVLPMRKGEFMVDNEVEAFSLVLFHPKPVSNLQLKDPHGKNFQSGQAAASSAAQNLYWRKTKPYDLIHVTNPIPGQWKIGGNRHPDSRLIVKSNTNLVATLLPSQIYQGERFAYEAYLTREQVPVKNTEDLAQLKIQLALKGTTSKEIIHLKDDGEVPDRGAGDGIFTGIMSPQVAYKEQDDSFSGTKVKAKEAASVGAVMLVTEATLGNIERQVQQKIHVLPISTSFKVESSWLNNVGVYTVSYFLDIPEANEASIGLYAKVRRKDGKIKLHHLSKLPTGGWQVHFEDEPHHGPFSIEWRAKGETAAGRYIVLDLPQITVDEVPAPTVIETVAEVVSAPELLAQKDAADFDMPFKQLFFILAVINLLYVALMYGVKTWLESQRRVAGNHLLARLFENESIDSEAEEGKANT